MGTTWSTLQERALATQGVIVVTGACGWAGSTLLRLLAANTDLVARGLVRAFARDQAQLLLPNCTVPVLPLKELHDIQEAVTLFAPFAFLTRDRLVSMPEGEYWNANRLLIDRSTAFIRSRTPEAVVSVSSGAATLEERPSAPLNAYGLLKQIEETAISEACSSAESAIALGRLWGAMGSTMPVARKYAVSDFICQALLGGEIEVRSGSSVYRRYSDMGEFLEVLVGLSLTDRHTMIDSGGPLIEVGELAKTVADELGATVVRNHDTTADDDNYFPTSSRYEDCAAALGIELSPIDVQVRQTISGHKQEVLRPRRDSRGATPLEDSPFN